MELGERIKKLRLHAKLTQEQLAESLGVAAQSVSKWENSVSMPDITLLPKLAEVFGVSIDDLFDLTAEQRLNRIENRLDIEEDLPHDVYVEYEEYLKAQHDTGEHKKRAAYLLALMYWNAMRVAGKKVSRYAREHISENPKEKQCQWMLNMAEGHYVWDWNLSNHNTAIEFYREVAEKNPDAYMPLYYLIDNLIADHRADEAEYYLKKLESIKGSNATLCRVYKAYIALARFNEPLADEIIGNMLKEDQNNHEYLFEAAQYYARKCDYKKAIDMYETAYEKDPQKPRFIDALQGIAEIYVVMRDYKKAADTYDRIIASQRDDWGLTEETELKDSMDIKAKLLEKAKIQ